MPLSDLDKEIQAWMSGEPVGGTAVADVPTSQLDRDIESWATAPSPQQPMDLLQIGGGQTSITPSSESEKPAPVGVEQTLQAAQQERNRNKFTGQPFVDSLVAGIGKYGDIAKSLGEDLSKSDAIKSEMDYLIRASKDKGVLDEAVQRSKQSGDPEAADRLMFTIESIRNGGDRYVKADDGLREQVRSEMGLAGGTYPSGFRPTIYSDDAAQSVADMVYKEAQKIGQPEARKDVLGRLQQMLGGVLVFAGETAAFKRVPGVSSASAFGTAGGLGAIAAGEDPQKAFVQNAILSGVMQGGGNIGRNLAGGKGALAGEAIGAGGITYAQTGDAQSALEMALLPFVMKAGGKTAEAVRKLARDPKSLKRVWDGSSSRRDIALDKKADREAVVEAVKKAKPQLRWNPKTGELEPREQQSESVTRGRPELANPAMTPEGREFVRQVQQKMVDQGEPMSRPWSIVESEANQRLQANREGEKRRLLEGNNVGKTDTDVFVEKAIIRDMENRAANMSPDEYVEGSTAVMNWHRGGTDIGRAFAARRDAVETKAERYATVGEAMLTPDKKTMAKVEKWREQSSKSSDPSVYDKRIRKALSKWGEQMQDYKAELKKLFKIDLENTKELSPEEMDAALFYLQAFRSDWLDKVLELRRNFVLTAPSTHLANMIGNTAHGGYLFGYRIPMEIALRKMGNPKGVNSEEAKAIYTNVMSRAVLSDAWRNAKKSFQLEVDAYEHSMGRRFDPTKLSGKTDIGHKGAAIRGRLGRMVRLSQRGLLFEDQIAKTIVGKTMLASSSHRIASREGLKPNTSEYNARVQELMNTPNSAAHELAIEMEREATFTTPRLKNINKWRSEGNGRYLQIPLMFTTTPTNILLRGIKMSPGIGTAKLAYDIATGRTDKIPKGIADQIAGGLALAALLALNDPDDPEAPLRITGAAHARGPRWRIGEMSQQQPQTVYIGDIPLDYSRIEPFATMLSYTVDLAQGIKRATGAEDTFKIMDESTSGLLDQSKNKTFVKGIADLVDAAELAIREGSVSKGVADWSKSFAVSFSPNVLRSSVRATDPYFKQTKSWGEGWDYWTRLADRARMQAGIPSKDDQIAYDFWGRPRSLVDVADRPMTDLVWRLISPLRMNEQPPFIGTDIMAAWNRNNPDKEWNPQDPRPWFDNGGEKIWLTDEQYAQYWRLSGRLAAYRVKQLAEMERSPFFKNRENPTERDIEKIKSIVTRSRTTVKNQLLSHWRRDKAVSDEQVQKTLRVDFGEQQ